MRALMGPVLENSPALLAVQAADVDLHHGISGWWSTMLGSFGRSFWEWLHIFFFISFFGRGSRLGRGPFVGEKLFASPLCPLNGSLV
jgi:hypothetical protein